MDPYTDIANNIQEVQYLLEKMQNEIICCLKAISTIKTCLRELATAFADKKIDNPTESEVDAIEEAVDGDSSLAVITEAGLVQSVTLNFPQEAGNAQLLFETTSYNLSIYNFRNSTVCENAPATFHSDSNMICPLNVSRRTLFDWEYVQLMMAWYLRFSLLWIEENVQRLNFWWLFDLACHSSIRLETETYVLGYLEDVRVVSLNMGSLAAAAKYSGDFEDILRATMMEVEEIDTKIILFIFEVYLVFSAGKTKSLMEAANQLKHMLYRGQLRCSDAIPLGEFEQYVEKDTAIGNMSYIAEPSIADTIRIFRGLEVKYDRHQDDKALVMAALSLAQYIVSLYLPDKANGFEDAVCTNVRVPLDSQPEEISNLERKRIQLEVKVHSLAREKDKASKTHVAGGSFTFKRDAPNDNLDKEIKISLFL
ncbi:hypothetical protein QQ045_033481 [Rhodiola kirilowii]